MSLPPLSASILAQSSSRRKGSVIRNPARSNPRKEMRFARSPAVCVRSGCTPITSTKELAGRLLKLSQAHRAGSVPPAPIVSTKTWTSFDGSAANFSVTIILALLERSDSLSRARQLARREGYIGSLSDSDDKKARVRLAHLSSNQ